MHPYRTAWRPEPERASARETADRGLALALGVMAIAAAVQIAAAGVARSPRPVQTLFGGACLVVASVGLADQRAGRRAHRAGASGDGSRRR